MYLRSFSVVLKMLQSLYPEGKVDYNPSDMASNTAKDKREEKPVSIIKKTAAKSPDYTSSAVKLI